MFVPFIKNFTAHSGREIYKLYYFNASIVCDSYVIYRISLCMSKFSNDKLKFKEQHVNRNTINLFSNYLCILVKLDTNLNISMVR
jgi:hypothetical protein